MSIAGDDVDDWCKVLGAMMMRHDTDRRAAVLAALVASALTADETTRDKLAEAGKAHPLLALFHVGHRRRVSVSQSPLWRCRPRPLTT